MPIIPDLSHFYQNSSSDDFKSRTARARAETKAAVPHAPQAEIDMPDLIYSEFLQRAKTDDDGSFNKTNPMGTLPNSETKLRVGIVGGGMSGLLAAYELSLLENIEITVFEAEEKWGGRCRPVRLSNSKDLAELGCMRFPPAEDLFYFYCDQFDVKFEANFPDPGVVRTGIIYRDQVTSYFKDPEEPEVPANFDNVRQGFIGLLTKGIYDATVNLHDDPEAKPLLESSSDMKKWLSPIPQHKDSISPPNFHTPSNPDAAKAAWQNYLNSFGNLTFFEGLKQIFTDRKIRHPETGEMVDIKVWYQDDPLGKYEEVAPWSKDDHARFGALGIGSGGFNPLLQQSFNYIWRLMPNGLEDNQQPISGEGEDNPDYPGTLQLVGKLVHELGGKANVFLRNSTEVINLSLAEKSKVMVHLEPGDPSDSELFDVVILATQTRAMQNMGATLSTGNDLFKQDVNYAINQTHQVDSSKLFVRVKRWWEKDDKKTIKQILTDGLAPQCYTLDYGETTQDGENTVSLLLSYVWEDDATKLSYLSNLENFRKEGDSEEMYGINYHDVLEARAKYAWFMLYRQALDQAISNVTLTTPDEFELLDDLTTFLENVVPLDLSLDDVQSGTTYKDQDIVTAFHKHSSMIHWTQTPNQFGAFTLQQTGGDIYTQSTFYDYLKDNLRDKPILLANDSMGFSGGWIEGGLKPAINAVSAIISKWGTLNDGEEHDNKGLTPMDLDSKVYDYGSWPTNVTSDPK